MEVNVELKCSDTRETKHLKITVNDWEGRCVKDLKKIFEEEIQVPCCDQKLSYQGRQFGNDNLFPLVKLYLREGDTVSLECISQGKLKEMKEFLKDIKDFSDFITSKNQTEILTFNELTKDDRSSRPNYDHVTQALELLSFDFFIPWKNVKSVVHRHFFVQEGGFDAFMEVLKFANKRYTLDGRLMAKKYLGECKEGDLSVLENHLKRLNDKQMGLHADCLSFLWNFSETWHDRRLLIQEGGLPYVVKALLSNPDQYLVFSEEYWQVARINETAVGCLVQYAEFPDCQQVIAQSSKIVNKLIFMLEASSQLSFPLDVTHSNIYTEYASQIAANTLFCCACSVQTPKILVENGMHKKMIDLMQQADINDLATSYYCTLFLARIRSSALVQLDSETAQSIDDLIVAFLEEYSPIDVSTWEEKHNYVWVTMIPFVSLAFSGKQYEREKSALVSKKSEKEGYSSKPHLAGSKCDIMERKVDTKVGAMVGGNQSHSGKHADSTSYSPGSWFTGTTSCPRMLGSLETQQLGLFTLKHMLNSSENRQLLDEEHLLPYLQCLCWYVGAEDGRIVKEELTKHWTPSPAPLKIICKSSLAFQHGFEAAFKM